MLQIIALAFALFAGNDSCHKDGSWTVCYDEGHATFLHDDAYEGQQPMVIAQDSAVICINGDPVSWCRDDPHPEVRKQLLWASGPSTPLDKLLEHRGAGKFTGDGLLPAVGADNHTYRTYQSREEREHQIREQRQSRAYHQNLREANWG